MGVLVFLLTLLVRAANAGSVFRGGSPQIGPFDDLYHAARIVYSAQHPGRVLNFDPNRGLHGAFCPWPPLYDVVAGETSRILGGSTPGETLVRAVWLPPLVSSIFAALVAAWMTRRSGTFVGFLAGAGLALSAVYLEESRVGDIDHHFLEPPLLFGIVAATALLRRARNRGSIARLGALFGGALTAALFVQTALLLAAAVSLLAVLVFPRDAIAPRWAGAVGFGIAALTVFAFRLTQPGGYPESAWFLGLPHAAALFAAAVACAVSAIALPRRAFPSEAFLTAIAIGGLAGACVPSMIENVVGGIGFLGGDHWLRTIIEFQPLFFEGPPGLWAGFCKLGGGVLFLLPLVLAGVRRGGTRRSVLALFGVAYLLASLSSMRFVVCAGPLLTVIGAVVIADRRDRAIPAAAASLLLLGPSFWMVASMLRDPRPPVGVEALPFLRAADVLRTANERPQHVLAPWSWGHLFELVGAQAPVVDGFGSSIGLTDFENALGVILLANEDHVADYCRSSGIRYVVLDNPLRRLTVQAETIGLSPEFFVSARAGQRSRILPLMRFSFWWRAYFDHGRPVHEPTRSSDAFRHFRLIYADPQSSDGPERFRGPAVQIWELSPL